MSRSNIALINEVIASQAYLPYVNRCCHSTNGAPCKRNCLAIARKEKVVTNCFTCSKELLRCQVAADFTKEELTIEFPKGVDSIDLCIKCLKNGF